MDIAPVSILDRTGGRFMVDMEIYVDTAAVVIALAVDLVAIYLYRGGG